MSLHVIVRRFRLGFCRPSSAATYRQLIARADTFGLEPIADGEYFRIVVLAVRAAASIVANDISLHEQGGVEMNKVRKGGEAAEGKSYSEAFAVLL